jgi:hypothetical protein
VHRQLVTVLVVAAATVLPAGLAAATSVPAPSTSVGIRLVPSPGAQSGNPLAADYIIEHMAPGTSITRSVEIDNESSAPMSVSVYAAGANVVRGRFAFSPGHTSDELSSWTSVGQGALRLAPGARRLDAVAISVPRSALPGSRTAVVWAEVSARAGDGVTLANRVGVRIYLSVGSSASAPPIFGVGPIEAARTAAGAGRITTSAHNLSGSTFSVRGALVLTNGLDGLRAGPFTAVPTSILAPGASARVAVSLAPSFPRGPWHATFVLTNGSVTRSVSATILFPPAILAASNGGIPPIADILAVIALLLAAGVVIRAARRRSASTLEPDDIELLV